jgi:hypothetical protein
MARSLFDVGMVGLLLFDFDSEAAYSKYDSVSSSVICYQGLLLLHKCLSTGH